MNVLNQAPITIFMGKAGLAAGTTTTTTTSNGTVFVYSIAGRTYTATGASNGATPTTDAVTGAAFTAIPLNRACVFLWGYNAAGSLRVVQGTTVYCDDSGVMVQAPQLPGTPDDFCPIGAELVKVISTGSAWTMGVSNQASQTGITKTFTDLTTLPARPIIA